MDPRQRRSRDRLSRAVLELAATRNAGDITVSELAAEAGVNRSTFYEHASSPIELLRLVLRTELDELRPQLLSDSADSADSAGAAIPAVTREVLDHIDRHAGVYRHGLGEGSAGASLHSMLSEQIRETIGILIDRGTIVVPGDPAAPDHDRRRAIASSFVADGTVGAIGTWLDEPEPRDAEGFLRAYGAALPSWWPWAASGADGERDSDSDSQT